jgi:hypothetical protein
VGRKRKNFKRIKKDLEALSGYSPDSSDLGNGEVLRESPVISDCTSGQASGDVSGNDHGEVVRIHTYRTASGKKIDFGIMRHDPPLGELPGRARLRRTLARLRELGLRDMSQPQVIRKERKPKT